MAELSDTQEDAAVTCATQHALGWLVFGNVVGLYLSLLVLFPALQATPWTYGRWVPVHLNVQLYGWTALPLVAWLFVLFEVKRSGLLAWAQAATWAWTAALGVGVVHWLGGISSGKIFLDWRDGSLWALVASHVILWCVLAASLKKRASAWSRTRLVSSVLGLAVLALVPVSLIYASSPALYPPIDRTTGGPLGSSLLGSALVVVGLMLMLPRVVAVRTKHGRTPGIWLYFLFSWITFFVCEAMGGTHFHLHQNISMLILLPWVWWLPHDWKRFAWPEGASVWRWAMFGWWGVLVVSALAMYQPGVLDQLKFTQGLVAHSHLAMAGFTTSFCALLLVLLTGRPVGGSVSVAAWHIATVVMIGVLTAMGWQEGESPDWMLARTVWRETGFWARAGCGLVMLVASANWWRDRRKS